MSLAVVVTTRNERAALDGLLAALRAQTLAPDEVVIVDGGSDDGTLEALQAAAVAWPLLRVIEDPGSSIGRGRNRGIAAARSDRIAVTDAGCRPEPGWLAALAATLAAGADVAAGVFVPCPATRLERAVTALLTRPPEELDDDWNPSSRSMAFTRDAWARVGGYPEEVPTGEDTKYCLALREAGYAMRLAREAVVAWQPRTGYRAFVRQYHRYAYGDGLLGTATFYYGAKTALYLVFLAGLGSAAAALAGVGWAGPAAAVAVAPWLAYHLRCAGKMIRRGAADLVPTHELPVMISYDLAEITGFARGVGARGRGHGAG